MTKSFLDGASGLGKGLVKIGNNIVNMLDTNRDTDQVRANTRFPLLYLGHLPVVRHACRMEHAGASRQPHALLFLQVEDYP